MRTKCYSRWNLNIIKSFKHYNCPIYNKICYNHYVVTILKQSVCVLYTVCMLKVLSCWPDMYGGSAVHALKYIRVSIYLYSIRELSKGFAFRCV